MTRPYTSLESKYLKALCYAKQVRDTLDYAKEAYAKAKASDKSAQSALSSARDAYCSRAPAKTK